KCTPLNTETIPTGVGEVWYSHCCTVSETSTATPPVTETKQYCYSYSLQGYPNNQFSGIKPACSKSGSGNNAWALHGQCSTSGTTDPYALLPVLVPDGCPGEYDSSESYEVGDTVEDDGAVYTCVGAAAYCNLYAPNLRNVGANYWQPTNSCSGVATPTASPAFGTIQAGCPEEFDSGTAYYAGDSVSVTRDDGVSIMYTCKPWPASQWCSVGTYSPLSTVEACNGDVCWPEAWISNGACTGTFTPTSTPTFDP
ncbi:hypothetical protein ACHAWT_002323, partial [Skeletonema menzelii]